MQAKDALIGREIDGYRIEALLGHGGMGRVYRALDIKLDRFAALKVLDPGPNQRNDYEARFNREAQAVARLKHPNIVGIYRFNQLNDLYYMAMEYIDGADLRWVLSNYADDGILIDYRNLLLILTQIGSALDFAHQNGVIHRDVKPSNIMIARSGEAILTDFGLALDVRHGTQGSIFGTPHYIAPEQAIHSGDAVSQTDIYSLGVILYQMLTGNLPFAEGSAVQVAMAHIHTPPPDPRTLNPALHGAFIPVLETALSKAPQDRYQTAAALVIAVRQAIEQAEQRQQVPATTSSRPAERIRQNIAQLPDPRQRDATKPGTVVLPPPRTRRRSRPLVVVLLLLLIGLGGGYAAQQYGLVDMTLLDTIRDRLLPVDSARPATNAVIEGVVTAIETGSATLVIFDLPVSIDRSHPLWNAAEIGDDVRIAGYALQDGDGYRFNRIDNATRNGIIVRADEP